MAVSTEGFAGYLGASPDNGENLQMYLDAAKSKARSAGVPDFRNNAQYDLFIYALAGMYYDNRSMTFGGTYAASAEESAQRMINGFVLSLRHAGEDPDG